MKRFFYLSFALLIAIITSHVYGQNAKDKLLDDVFKSRGEVYFTFRIKDKPEINNLTKIISIDGIKGNDVTAYANRSEFSNFLEQNYSYTILTPPGMLLKESELNMGAATTDNDNRTIWNFYPTYQQYLDYMAGFATLHPEICKLDTIGLSIQGRLILALKISDSVQYNRGKPQFFYTSSIHGDEITGYILMLHLIDYLLTNYGTDPYVTNLVNSTQIYINPLSNPDGTYHGGNNTVYGATRYNANNVDLNRNYPDPADGPHPDGNAWQQETLVFMDFADSNSFVMSMNFHGGAEVFNYPWDTWAKLHPDDSWFDFLGREYADTVHKYSPAGYFVDQDNGVTNGYAWYRITGGRQDYMTYFQNGREVTLEISMIKTLPANQLLNFWDYNYRSFLNYIQQSSYGINGQVTDTLTGLPLSVKVNIFTHDFDNSSVYSDLPSGWYFRPIDAGTYNLSFSASGYFPKAVKNVNVNRRTTTRVNVKMVPLSIGGVDEKVYERCSVYPNPSHGLFKLDISDIRKNPEIKVVNLVGQTVKTGFSSSKDNELFIDLSGYPKGIYFIVLNDGYQVFQKKIVLN